MKKNSNILIATDFSKHSDYAVLLGSELQKKFGGNVTVVHISDVSPVWDWPASDTQARNLLGQFQKEITVSLEKLMKDQMVRCEVEFEGLIKFGNAHKELLSLVTSSDTHVLVMGHKGQTGLFSLGSFAEKMVATSPVPVLIAKNDKSIKKVCALIDLTHFSKDSINYAKDFAGYLGAKTQYLSIVPDVSSDSLSVLPFLTPTYQFSEVEKQQIISNAQSLILKNSDNLSEKEIHVEISSLPTAKALSKALVELKTDLAIVSKHNRGPLEKLFIGSVSKGILHEFDGNFLVFPSL